jgi:hypothetical protein
MNRCTPRFIATLTLLAAVCLGSAPVSAQTPEFKPAVRQFPAAALRGEMVVRTAPIISMDSKPDRLSPGARIRDANNMLVMSGALVEQTLVVNYLRENTGLVHQVWILNSEEIRLKRPNTRSSWFSFGSSTDAEAAPSVQTP